MKDILGREIKDYDLVVGKGTGRHVRGMSIGIWIGKSMATADCSKRSMCDVYLIENPTQKELEIKENIIKALEEEAAGKKVRNEVKCIKASELVEGGIYEDLDSYPWVYLGDRVLKFYTKQYNNWKEEWSEEGRCFHGAYKLESIEDIMPFYWSSNQCSIRVLKTSKKLVKLVGKIDIPEVITFTDRDAGKYDRGKKIVMERRK